MEEIVFKPEFETCPRCGSTLKYHCMSPWREVQTLERRFSARWVIFRCERCTVGGNPLQFRSAELQRLVLSNMRYGVDVVVRVGYLIQEEHLVGTELKEKFMGEYGLTINRTHFYKIFDRYLELVSAVQEEMIPELREKFGREGYVLGIDGQVWGESRTLLILRDTMRGVTLHSEIVDEEGYHPVAGALRTVRERFGAPVGVVSDMKNEIINAVRDVFPGVPHQFCQQHFLKNVGEGLLKTPYEDVKKRMEPLKGGLTR